MFNRSANGSRSQPPTPRTDLQVDPAAPAPAPAAAAHPQGFGAAPRAPVRNPSGFGADLVFEGKISGDGELLIDGLVKGEIHVSRLVIGEHAQIEGTVRGNSIEVRGRVHGNIEGKAVKLYESAHVEGDILHEQLSIDTGAYFQGRCQQYRQTAAQAAPSASVGFHPPAPSVTPAAAAAPVQGFAGQVIELDPAARS